MKTKYKVGDLIEFNLPGARTVIECDIGIITSYDAPSRQYIVYWFLEKSNAGFTVKDFKTNKHVRKIS